MRDQYLTKREVANFLGVSTRQIDRLDADQRYQRTFPCPVRIAGRKRWLASEIEAWAAAQQT
jgi:predicted DNA-binding transcriptional regulator AlpA